VPATPHNIVPSTFINSAIYHFDEETSKKNIHVEDHKKDERIALRWIMGPTMGFCTNTINLVVLPFSLLELAIAFCKTKTK
jgi:hypothetical protein